jgi:hypothetical protein
VQPASDAAGPSSSSSSQADSEKKAPSGCAHKSGKGSEGLTPGIGGSMLTASLGRGVPISSRDVRSFGKSDGAELGHMGLSSLLHDNAVDRGQFRRHLAVPLAQTATQEAPPKRRRKRDGKFAASETSSCSAAPDPSFNQNMLPPRAHILQDINSASMLMPIGSAFSLPGSHMLPGAPSFHHNHHVMSEDGAGKFACIRLRESSHGPALCLFNRMFI